jgi:hypothetical protein
MNKLIYILLIFCSQIGYAQTQTITAKVANGSDDVEISNRLYTSSSDLELGGFDSDNNGKQFTLIRFQNLALPVNSTVTKAYIQFFTKSANAQRANLSIRCQLGNAPAFSNLANALSRIYTANSVAWNPLAWTLTGESGLNQRTSDLASIINAAKASTWQSGGALSFKIEGNATTNNILNARSADYSSFSAPILVIEYQIGNPCASDIIAPIIINCPTNISLRTTGSSAIATWAAPTVSDNCTQNITPSQFSSPTAGFVSGSAFPIGTTTIDYEAKDALNNKSLPCRFNVTVEATPLILDKISFNEVAPKGTLGISEDWIELYNGNDFAVPMDSVYIATKATNPFKKRLKGLTLPAKGFLLLIADNDTLKGLDHVDFKLSANGEKLFLFKKENELPVQIAKFEYTALASDEENITLGGNTEGGITPAPAELTKFLGGTPRAANATGKRFLRIENNVPRGIITSGLPTSITLTPPAGATLRFTTDHSSPSRTNGNSYTTPITINISTTTVLKTFAYTDNGETNVESFTYIYPVKGAELTFPDLVTQADYENGLKTLPIVSISTNLGVVDTKVEKGCSFEYINKFGETGSASVLAGVEGFGNYSFLFQDQRNLRLSFKSAYGFSKFRFPIFKKDDVDTNNPADKFDKLDLKIGQDGPSGAGFGMVMTSQGLVSKTMRELGNIDLHTQYAHVFVNGAYHGVYILKEKYDERFAAEYYGGEKEQYDVIESSWESGRVNAGTITNWATLKSLVAQNRFQEVKRYLNVNQFIDFMMLMMYFDNEWEYRAVADRNLTTTKFVLEDHDTDGALVKISDENEYTYDKKWTDPTRLVFNGPAGMFGTLYNSNNKEFKTLVRDRVYEAFQKPNGALTLGRITTKLEELKALVKPVFNLELARFNKTFYNDNPYFDEEYGENIAHLPTRYQHNLDKWLEKGLVHTLLPVTFSQPSGTVTTPVLVINPNNKGTIYYTLDGTDPMGSEGTINPVARIYTTQLALNIGLNKVVARVYFNEEFGPKTTATYTTATAIAALQVAQILSVEGRVDGKRGVLNWITKTTQASDYFRLEKRNAQGQFETLHTVNALYSNNPTGIESYLAYDETLVEGENTYRVALVSEILQTPQYSELVILKGFKSELYAISPNPASNFIDIDLGDLETKEVSLTVFNSIGKVVFSERIEKAGSTKRFDTEGLEAGQYFIHIEMQGKRSVVKKVTIVR